MLIRPIEAIRLTVFAVGPISHLPVWIRVVYRRCRNTHFLILVINPTYVKKTETNLPNVLAYNYRV